MENETAITFHCIRKDGKLETTGLTHHTLSDARELAKWVLHIGNGLYTRVEICTEDGVVETVQNPAAAPPVETR